MSTPSGSYIPLGQIATVEEVTGPTTIYRQNLQRYAPVKFSVRGRDLAGAIEEAQTKINAQVKLPYGMHYEWEGRYSN